MEKQTRTTLDVVAVLNTGPANPLVSLEFLTTVLALRMASVWASLVRCCRDLRLEKLRPHPSKAKIAGADAEPLHVADVE